MKLAEALSLVQKPPLGAPPYSVFLACGFSPLHLQTYVSAHLQQRLGWPVEVKTGLYGSLADTLEQISHSQEEAAVVFLEWPDVDARLGFRTLGGWGDIDLAGVESTLTRLLRALQKKPAGLRLVLSLPTLPMAPGFHTVNAQASAAELGLEKLMAEFGAEVAFQPATFIVNRQQLSSGALADRYDFRSDLNAGFPYTLRHADQVAELIAGLLAPAAPRKGLISDLDDTLWRGIVGEEGAAGVSWDLAGHAQMHGLYQQLLQSLAKQGVLIGVASKNNAEVAEAALQRKDMVLKRDSVFPVEIHWDPKSGSVSRILKTWNVGAESVVFIDDSPMELEEVRAAHPEIECLLFPKRDPAAVLLFLRHLRDLLGKPTLSQEDSFRLESIRSGQQFLAGAGDEDLAESFLASASATMTVEWDPDPSDQRVLELVNKTNQFNLNGTRFTEAEWRKINCKSGSFVAVISYADKFGPLGKISVLQGQKTGNALMLQSWVMSCRAFSRRIEFQTLQLMFDRFKIDEIRFHFVKTQKNRPMEDFLRRLGGERDGTPEIRLTKAHLDAGFPALYHQVVTVSSQSTVSRE